MDEWTEIIRKVLVEGASKHSIVKSSSRTGTVRSSPVGPNATTTMGFDGARDIVEATMSVALTPCTLGDFGEAAALVEVPVADR